ncbi:MAG: LemA family protein [Candidatus Micrarchaeota archaeon]|nr:LemA family protein [Candidatus Micrarchaeota archaeon]
MALDLALGLGMAGICIIGILAIALIVGIALVYNSLVSKRNKVQNAWAQIDVQLKKRFDLVPNLVETVKGYAKHEKGLFEEVTKARAAVMSAKTPQESAKANDMLSTALKSLFAVAENYPKLRANENFLHLQSELSEIEGKIAYARQFYNDSVYEYNTSLQIFPNSLFAGLLGFKASEFFKAGGNESKPVNVKF